MTTRLDQNAVDQYRGAVRAKTIKRHSGLFILPVAEPPPEDAEKRKNWSPFQAVRAHAPIQLEEDVFDYEKENAPPVVPDMTDGGHLTFLEGELTIPVPTPNTNGGMTWRAGGEYRYASKVPADALKQSGVVLPNQPWVLTSQRADAEFPGPANGTSPLPPAVEKAGVGPKVGWSLANGSAAPGDTSDVTAPGYVYREPTYFPNTFFSDDVVVGPPSYTGLGPGQYEYNELRGGPG